MKKLKKFSKLRYPIHEMKNGEQLEQKFPQLFDIPEFKNFRHKSREKIIKYIIYLYDKGTDFFDEFPDLRKRKEAAATEAGFKRTAADNWPKEVEELMSFKGELGSQFKYLMFGYLRQQNYPLWREIQATEQELEYISESRMQPPPELDKKDYGDIMSKRKNLSVMAEEGLERLDRLKNRFYADHDDAKEATKDILIPIRPENADRVLKQHQNVS